jgi:ribosome production factor 2
MSEITHKGKLALKDKEPKIDENRKKSLFIKGKSFPSALNELWEDLERFRVGESVKYNRPNEVLPFEDKDRETLEKYCMKNDCSLFAFANSNKKRPNNLIFGRLFNYHILDMYEFGVTELVPHKEIKSNFEAGTVPAVIFQGEQWDNELKHLRSFFMDYLVGDLKGRISLDQVTSCVVLTYVEADKTILFRHYSVVKSGATTNLELIAPSFNLVRRREQLPDDDMLDQSFATLEKDGKKKKKTHIDELGREVGKVYVGKNDTSKIQPKKFRGLPKRSEREIVQDVEVDGDVK